MLVSDQIIAVLDNLCQKFGIMIDWSQQNILPYLQELAGRYITYEICTSIVWCAIMAVPLIVAAVLTKLGWKSGVESLAFPATFALVIISIIFFVVAATQAFDIVECLTIPEKTLIEYLSLLMKRN